MDDVPAPRIEPGQTWSVAAREGGDGWSAFCERCGWSVDDVPSQAALDEAVQAHADATHGGATSGTACVTAG